MNVYIYALWEAGEETPITLTTIVANTNRLSVVRLVNKDGLELD